MKHHISYIALLIVLFFSACKSKEEKDIEGFWTNGEMMLSFEGDTMNVYPLGETFRIFREGDNVYVAKTLELRVCWECDSIKHTCLFGKILTTDGVTTISTVKDGAFTKLKKYVGFSKLKKFQLSTTYLHGGYNWEIDTLGNALLSGGEQIDNPRTFSFKLSNDDLDAVLSLYPYVQLDSLKRSYRCEHCKDAGLYSFSFFTEEDTVDCCIEGELEHYSLAPLRILLTGKVHRYAMDTLNYLRVPIHFFYSRIAACDDDGYWKSYYSGQFAATSVRIGSTPDASTLNNAKDN